MADPTYRIVETDDDLAAWTETLRLVRWRRLWTPDELRHRRISEPQRTDFVAMISGEPVGGAAVMPMRWSPNAAVANALWWVIQSRRSQGIGSELYRLVSEQARLLGKSRIVTEVLDHDAHSSAFLDRRGFKIIGRARQLVLELREDVDLPKPAAGFRLVGLDKRPDLVPAAYQLAANGTTESPAPLPRVAETLDRWRIRHLEGPDALPGGCFAAIRSSEVIGVGVLRARGAEPGSADHLLTAVRSDWRGRGVGTAIRVAQIAWARRAGLSCLVSLNQEANVALARLNSHLGYRCELTVNTVQGPLATR